MHRNWCCKLGLALILGLAGSAVAEIGGVIIDSVSSENATVGRQAAHLVDGSGLSALGWDTVWGTHSDSAVGNMWLNSDATVGDVNQQWIIFDLKAVYNLQSTKIWNYNEGATPRSSWPMAYWAKTRGVYNMEILVSADKITWTSKGSYNLAPAPGEPNVAFGETIALNAPDVRYVKFKINSNQAARWGFASDGYVGLSEVQFTPVPAPPLAGVTIDSVRTENTILNRLAVDLVNGNGLNVNGTDTHTDYPAGNMWLNSDATIHDANQWIIFDMNGVTHNLGSVKIWNYNEGAHPIGPANWPYAYWARTRGVYEMEILLSADKTIWTSKGRYFLSPAPGEPTIPFGETIALNTTGVRYVKFVTYSNQSRRAVGYTTNDYIGLSEVQFMAILPVATAPNPEDKQQGVSQCPVLSWTAGFNCHHHNVYFGINSGSLPLVSSNQTATTYSPATLVPGQKYYWRIDEVNDSSVVTTGSTWSFVADMAGKQISGVTIQSVSSEYMYTNPGNGVVDNRLARDIVDGNGMDDVNRPDTHSGQASGTMWLSGNFTWVDEQYVVFNLGAARNLLNLKVWNYNEQVAPDWGGALDYWAQARGVDEMEISVSTNNSTWTSLGLFNLQAAPGNATVPFGQRIFTFANNYQYVKFKINSNLALKNGFTDDMVGLSEVRFYEPTSYAAFPMPRDKTKGVAQNITLSWSPGQAVVSHDVYFGTTFADVNSATVPTVNQPCNAYSPSNLVLGKTYYWRIDERTASTTYRGPVWSFTVIPPVCTAPLAGDLNGDCVVNFKDIAVMAANWLTTGCSAPGWCNGADLSQNGTVDFADLADLVNTWLQCTLPGGTCP